MEQKGKPIGRAAPTKFGDLERGLELWPQLQQTAQPARKTLATALYAWATLFPWGGGYRAQLLANFSKLLNLQKLRE